MDPVRMVYEYVIDDIDFNNNPEKKKMDELATEINKLVEDWE